VQDQTWTELQIRKQQKMAMDERLPSDPFAVSVWTSVSL
jgi:hypothetical protein